jgi:hypothetical protein
MSVLVTMKVTGDTGAFQKALSERDSEFKEIGDRAQGAGAIHHRFGIGDGFVLVVDEWETAEKFEEFFNDPELQAFIGTVGGNPTAPEITMTEAVSPPDEF